MNRDWSINFKEIEERINRLKTGGSDRLSAAEMSGKKNKNKTVSPRKTAMTIDAGKEPAASIERIDKAGGSGDNKLKASSGESPKLKSEDGMPNFLSDANPTSEGEGLTTENTNSNDGFVSVDKDIERRSSVNDEQHKNVKFAKTSEFSFARNKANSVDENISLSTQNTNNVGKMAATADIESAEKPFLKSVVADSGKENKTEHVSYARAVLKENDVGKVTKKVNFRSLTVDSSFDGCDLILPKENVVEVHHRFANTIFGYFLGKRLAYPIVENYVENAWAKYGLKCIMMNASGFFFFKFENKDRMDKVMKMGPWLI